MHEQFVVLQKSNNTSKQRALLFIWYTRYLFFHIFNSVKPLLCAGSSLVLHMQRQIDGPKTSTKKIK